MLWKLGESKLHYLGIFPSNRGPQRTTRTSNLTISNSLFCSLGRVLSLGVCLPRLAISEPFGDPRPKSYKRTFVLSSAWQRYLET